ncbi:multiple sugar transport system substrate-binding protein [Microbacterium natoriense]|uniref:Multiple sugar transport system substrate-binding protein n=1 Tax=Microbacterium natoriense TaxID=284570 RepID=A0AAW8EWU4_9MICO|nr:extracellular solute-binding protein [Microbacterium natoriense]MDQ0647955.1 multiple sugar transport system substrate-binding protein [Microbacterium natoriense]
MKFTRILGGVAALATASLLLSGCGRAEDTGSAPDDATTIDDGPATGTISIWAMGAEGEALPDFVKAFQEKNPDVKIDVTPIPWDAAHNKIQTAIAGGNTPDIAMMGTTWMADFSDAFATVPEQISTDGFFDGALSTTKVGDRAAGVPWYVDTRVLYYRTDIAEKAGWTEAPKTWDELSQMAADMQSKGGATWGMRLPAGNDSFQGAMWMPWSAGAELTDGKSWTLDTPEMAKGLEYYQSFFTDGIADPNVDTSPGSTEAEFVDGTAPMVVEGPFLRGQLEAVGGAGFADKYTTAVLPALEGSVSFSGGANLVVFQGSDNASSAWKLVDWLSQPETQAAFFEATGDLPASTAAWEEPAVAGDKSLATFGTQLETAKAPPVTTSWVKVAAKGDQALESLRRGTGDVAAVLKTLQADADAIGLD